MLCGILAKSFSSDLALGQGPRGAEARDAFAGVTHNENLIDICALDLIRSLYHSNRYFCFWEAFVWLL